MSVRTASFRTGLKEISARLEPVAMRRELAAFARVELERAIESGAASPSYRRYVNGREGVSEDEVTLPGPILYVFAPLKEAVEFALKVLKGRWSVRGPGRDGHYADSWIVLVNGRRWDGHSEIPPSAEAVIVNTQPYARKVHVGAKGFSVPKGIVEHGRQAVLKQWRLTLDAQVRFIELSGGYVLKGQGGDAAAWAGWAGRASRNAGSRRSVAGRSKGRRDSIAGTPMKYPALVIARRAD